MSVAWMRFFSAVRWRTRCSRKRARSRSARTPGVGSQISGTRSRRDSSARTLASILSVLAASGASPLTLTASPIATSSRPARAGRGRSGRPSSTRSPPSPADRLRPPGGPARPGRRRPGPRGHRERRTCLVHDMHIQTGPAQVQPNVQHEDRASFRHVFRLSPQAWFGGRPPSSWHSGRPRAGCRRNRDAVIR